MRSSCPDCVGPANGNGHAHGSCCDDAGSIHGSDGTRPDGSDSDCLSGPSCHGSGSGGRLAAILPSLASGHRGPHGTADHRVVLVGNPNVGKSSLFNAMLGMKARV